MRLCFYNPHAVTNIMGKTALSCLAQFFGANKDKMKKHNSRFNYLLDYLKKTKYETAIVVDGLGTSFGIVLSKFRLIKNNYFLYKSISFFEVYLWCFLNGLNPLKQKIIFKINNLDYKSDILFGFPFCSNIFSNEKMIGKSIIMKYNGKKILHASHYYDSTKRMAEIIKKTGTKLMAAEADLKKSPYFNVFFDYVDQVYILPHVLRDKYVKNVDFKERKNRVLALGTLVINNRENNSQRDYYDFFKINTLHPMRKIIFENRNELSDLIDCIINFHNKDRLKKKDKSFFYRNNRFFEMFYDLFFLSEGKEYHKFDIVKKYNEYKMFISPEENVGLPSINFIEGMACGCAYIGLNHPIYEDLGLHHGEHYISYDGTLNDLKNKICYYQINQKELEKIAQNGYEFVTNNFSKKKVMADFWKYLEKITS